MKMGGWVCRGAAGAALLSLTSMLVACGEQPKPAAGEHGAAEQEFERGRHNGRLLRSGDFAIEVTIFETGVPPEFHVYAYQDDKPVAPATVALTIMLKRLGGKTDTFIFKPGKDHLVGNGTVVEPHSFDVIVAAKHEGKTHRWTYASYEGRTIISGKAAAEAGVTIERTGPATIKQTIELLGHADLAPGAKASLRARFPGRVVSVTKNIGDAVRTGEPLARIESNESLQVYAIVAPFDGVILERNVNQGDIATDAILFAVGDPRKLVADFHVFDRDAARIRAGQAVRISSLDGAVTAESQIAMLSPVKDSGSQSIIARALFDNTGGAFRPGMTVNGYVVVEQVQVPLAVKTVAIQQFRDFEVVFAKFGETYEVRMLEIGRRSTEWTEVLGGINPGADYVVANSFLIKADIEKSGASHDH
ncbi:MAG: efflux RND transporter periplasmic adaptor subunit [Alphaproteobacteria bacterium]|nr:efflux RND transporter periplasmic adaptor subunit [Alphaproteobacteria bacterium]